MNDSLLQGELAPIVSIAKARTGRRPSPATVWRWVRKGVCGGQVRLQAVYHSGKWLTTPDAFDQFIQDQTATALASSEPEKPEDTSDADLIAAGLL
jgi:hypothetical protein